MALGIFGFCYTGCVGYKIYKTLPQILPAVVMKSSVRQGLACSAIDNFLHTPFLYVPSFYFATSLLQGRTWSDGHKALTTSGLASIVAAWKLWIPFQIVNFSLVPPHNRLVVVMLGNLCWNAMIDSISPS